MSTYLIRGRYTGLQLKTSARPTVIEHEWHRLKVLKIYTFKAVLALGVVLGTLSSPSKGTVGYNPGSAPDRAVFSRNAAPHRLSDWRERRLELIRPQDRFPGPLLRSDYYVLPLGASQARVSSDYGPRFHPVLRRTHFHKGLDFPRRRGTPVYPARSGRVTASGWKAGFGRVVEVRHSDGRTTIYGHLAKLEAKLGDWVTTQTVLGTVGSSGLSTGPHLHFEARGRDGRPMDPSTLFGRR